MMNAIEFLNLDLKWYTETKALAGKISTETAGFLNSDTCCEKHSCFTHWCNKGLLDQFAFVTAHKQSEAQNPHFILLRVAHHTLHTRQIHKAFFRCWQVSKLPRP